MPKEEKKLLGASLLCSYCKGRLKFITIDDLKGKEYTVTQCSICDVGDQDPGMPCMD